MKPFKEFITEAKLVARQEEGGLPDVLYNKKPDEVIKTGLKSSDGATSLNIFYHNSRTYVEAEGEAYNSDPWSFRGKPSLDDIKKEYLDGLE